MSTGIMEIDTKAKLVISPKEQVTQMEQAANACRAIIDSCTVNLQGKKYLQVTGYQAIAGALGCSIAITIVESGPEGVRAEAVVKRTNDGIIIGQAEGFVGVDEPVWYGGEIVDKYGKKKVLPKRANFAIRAMAQTRAISRAARTAFAHVVVLMDPNIQRYGAEEMEGAEEFINEERPSADDMGLLREKMQALGVEPGYMVEKFGSAKEMTKEIFKQAIAHLRELAEKAGAA